MYEDSSSNFQKHRIYFADAVSVLSVFSDDFAINIFEEHPEEERFIRLLVEVVGIVHGLIGNSY